MRLLTKSRFKLGLECPDKLFYTKKSDYAKKRKSTNKHEEDLLNPYSNQNYSLPKPEVWGDDSVGYSVEIFHPTGKIYFRYSDVATDTVSMKRDALQWYDEQTGLVLVVL